MLYAYQDGPVDNHFNRWLRQAAALGVPLAYFIGTRQNWYRPEYPVFVHDRPPVHGQQVRRRLHQQRFRGAVLPAYADRCAICRLKEVRLLDAAHIVADGDDRGEARIVNGLSLCTIHHRAYDQDLVGVSPDRTVHVSRALLDEDDGPMLELLKRFHGRPLELPARAAHRPDRELLAIRFDRFQAAGGR